MVNVQRKQCCISTYTKVLYWSKQKIILIITIYLQNVQSFNYDKVLIMIKFYKNQFEVSSLMVCVTLLLTFTNCKNRII